VRFAQVETTRDAGFYLSDIGQAHQYRPDLFGGAFSALCQQLMRGASEWTAGERELFAAFVSSQRQCPF